MTGVTRLIAAAATFLSSAGCYVLGGVGYENRLAPNGAGGGMAEVVAGAADQSLTGPDIGLRGEVGTQGSKVGAGLGFTAGIGDPERTWLAFVRPEGWLMPLRWGPADNDSWAHPALALGAQRRTGASKQRLLLLGLRAEYLFRADGFGRSLGWGLFVEYGEPVAARPER
jgi:hypothetical protein